MLTQGADLDLQGTLDKGAMQEFQAAQDRLRAVWPSGVNEILSERNPALLNELTKLEGMIDSLLVIPNKPAPLRKQWRETLEQYEKAGMLCVVYAKRHMSVTTGQ